MITRFHHSRRDFLRCGCRTIAHFSAAAAVGRLGLINARAQAAGDYKALVCVFQFGGNDANNMIIPLTGGGYAAYQSVRQNIAIAQNTLLPVTNSQGLTYGIHPSLAALQTLYTQAQDLAFVFNVGMLVRPITRDQYRQGGVQVPVNLFSHSDQQQQWQNAAPLGGVSTGWAGRVADRVRYLNASNFPTAVGVSGNSLQLVGQTTQPTTVSGDSFGLDGSDHTPAADARDAALQEILSLDSGATLVQASSKVLSDAIAVAKLVDQAAHNANPLNTVFPDTGLGQQLSQVAKVIQVRNELGMKRQIFFCSQGGYDTHNGQLGSHAELLLDLAQAMAAFYTAMGELGVRDNVTLFTESEFNRTFQPNNGAGTDHAWGGHQMVLGGPVKGGDTFGRFPTLALLGPDDSGTRGNWVPTAAFDQYGATLASWFGVNASDLSGVFPNIVNFPTANLGFMV